MRKKLDAIQNTGTDTRIKRQNLRGGGGFQNVTCYMLLFYPSQIGQYSQLITAVYIILYRTGNNIHMTCTSVFLYLFEHVVHVCTVMYTWLTIHVQLYFISNTSTVHGVHVLPYKST